MAERAHTHDHDAARERELLGEIEKMMRYLVRSRAFSPLNGTEFRTVRSVLDKLDEVRRG